jgi:hypothetical protein
MVKKLKKGLDEDGDILYVKRCHGEVVYEC